MGFLPKTIVIRSNTNGGNLLRTDEGYVMLHWETNVFSTNSRIDVEPAKCSDGYVHLRFRYSNRYWQKEETETNVIAVSKKPEEDTKNPLCTLFEPVKVNDNGMFYLIHVQTGGRVVVSNSSGTEYVVSMNPRSTTSGYMTFVNMETMIKMPEHIALKGDNNLYLKLKAYYVENQHYLQFGSSNPKDILSGHRVNQLPDGHVRIMSDHWGKFWRRNPNWVWADSTDTTADDRDTLFWPVRLDDDTISLRNAGSNNLCGRLTSGLKLSCLTGDVATMKDETKLQVLELVQDRRIFNVRYRTEHAVIFGERPFWAGGTTAKNYGDVEDSVDVEILYPDETSYNFNRGLSLAAGVTNFIQAGLAGIGDEGSIEIRDQINTTLEWGRTERNMSEVTAKGSVLLPARSKAMVSYEGTTGFCSIPYDYTQKDQSSVDGGITQTEQTDGIYTGFNSYNFNFVVLNIEPLY